MRESASVSFGRDHGALLVRMRGVAAAEVAARTRPAMTAMQQLRRTWQSLVRSQPSRGTLPMSRKEDEMTELATPPTEQQTDVKRINHWIGGRSVAGDSGRSGPVYNPARGKQTGAVDFATAEEVDRAVQAAKAAFPAWRAMSLSRKSSILATSPGPSLTHLAGADVIISVLQGTAPRLSW